MGTSQSNLIFIAYGLFFLGICFSFMFLFSRNSSLPIKKGCSCYPAQSRIVQGRAVGVAKTLPHMGFFLAIILADNGNG
uniref:Uncharacterized protein n=1 Tax=Picea glauca TaxID=3330 RepID=A0A117NHA2_PICGL|nr:hypothetical protein ABT39_MTgene5049 [Picea glauca]